MTTEINDVATVKQSFWREYWQGKRPIAAITVAIIVLAGILVLLNIDPFSSNESNAGNGESIVALSVQKLNFRESYFASNASTSRHFYQRANGAVELLLHGSSSCPPQIANALYDVSRREIVVNLSDEDLNRACTMDLTMHMFLLSSSQLGDVREVRVIHPQGEITVGNFFEVPAFEEPVILPLD